MGLVSRTTPHHWHGGQGLQGPVQNEMWAAMR